MFLKTISCSFYFFSVKINVFFNQSDCLTLKILCISFMFVPSDNHYAIYVIHHDIQGQLEEYNLLDYFFMEFASKLSMFFNHLNLPSGRYWLIPQPYKLFCIKIHYEFTFFCSINFSCIFCLLH